jgi:hypothetical protein
MHPYLAIIRNPDLKIYFLLMKNVVFSLNSDLFLAYKYFFFASELCFFNVSIAYFQADYKEITLF